MQVYQTRKWEKKKHFTRLLNKVFVHGYDPFKVMLVSLTLLPQAFCVENCTQIAMNYNMKCCLTMANDLKMCVYK